MARFRQLRTLLWKNLLVKRRMPFILILETIIPFILFIMLGLVRHFEPPQPTSTNFADSQPLPSAGILPMVQSFLCTNTPIDGDGLPALTENSTYYKWLTQIDKAYRLVHNSPHSPDGFGNSGHNRAVFPALPDEFSELAEIIEAVAAAVQPLPFDETCNKNGGAGYSRLAYAGAARLLEVICGDPHGNTDTNPSNSSDSDTAFNIYDPNRFNALLMFWEKFSSGQLKILYTPGNNSVVKQLIEKANHTFALAEELTLHAQHWLTNTSQEIRHHLSQIGKGSSTSNAATVLLDQIYLIDLAACTWLNWISQVNLSVFLPFDKEYEAVDYAMNQAHIENITIPAIIVFNIDANATMLSPHTSYKIRMNGTYLPSVRKLRSLYWSPMPRNWDYFYYTSGFMFLQDTFDRAIIDTLVGYQVIEPGSFTRLHPMACYIYDIFLFTNSMILPLCMTISYVYSAAILVQNIVSEKENGLKEFMKVMGLDNSVHGLAWFITAFVQLTFSVTVVTILLVGSKVLAHSDPLIIWLILEIYAVATITFCFLISSMFSKSKLASATAGMLYFLSYVPSMCIGFQEDFAGIPVSQVFKVLCCFLSTSAFGLSCKYIGLRESEGIGVQWENFATSPIENDSFSLVYTIGLLFVDVFLYAALAWYIENIYPGSYGIPKPWYFPFTKSYWTGTPSEEPVSFFNYIKSCYFRIEHCFRGKTTVAACPLNDSQFASIPLSDSKSFEKDPDDLLISVEITNLTKVYGKKGTRAVNNLSLKLYESQVLGLLGHNGAGKSSTMAILTGIRPPTSGSIRIYGHDIRQNLSAVRNDMGYCPQHNILFEQLTAEEHLTFYSGIKRMSNPLSKDEIKQTLADVGLTQKHSSVVGHLSGGMKRKLSIALAFLGRSRLVVLDEPTAGIDPYSRKAIWDLIDKYKPGRTILMSTHHMDEADALSDRIAIISSGELKCCGSSIFIRNAFCEGYHLVCVKGKTADVSQIIDFIKSSLESASICSETRDELHFVIPYVEERTGRLAPFFRNLEASSATLGISSYGIYDSTLEEAFLKVTGVANNDTFSSMPSNHYQSTAYAPYKSFESNSCSRPESEAVPSPTSLLPSSEKNSPETSASIQKRQSSETSHQMGIFKHLKHFRALMVKRFHYVRRSWKVLFSQIFLPSVFIATAMSMSLSATSLGDPDPFALSPVQYNKISQPAGIFTPTTNYALRLDLPKTTVTGSDGWIDAGPTNISNTLFLISGLSASCVLRSPNISLIEETHNLTSVNMKQYFNDECADAFVEDVPLSNFQAAQPNDSSPIYYPFCYCMPDRSGLKCPGDFDRAPQRQLVTGDHVIDIGLQNISEYLLYTTDFYRQHRYGALQLGTEMTNVPPEFGDGESKLRRLTVRRVAIYYFDNRGYHAQPIYLNVVNNAILRANIAKRPELGNPAAFGITTYNHPLNGTDKVSDQDLTVQGTDMMIAMFIIIAMSFVPASFVVFIVYEKSILMKHIQFMAGLHPVTYWITNYVWDLLNYLFPATCCIIILLAFNVPAFVAGSNLTAVIGLFLLYGWSMTPMMYPTSFLLDEPSKAYVVLVVLNLFIGTTCLITTSLLDLFSKTPILNAANNILKVAFLPFPSYCLGRGIMDVALNHYTNQFYILSGKHDLVVSPFTWNVVVSKYLAMILEGFVFFTITVLLETLPLSSLKSLCQKQNHSCASADCEQLDSDDSDVAAEQRRVLSGDASSALNDLLVIDKLSKMYTPKSGRILAVDKLTIGLPRGECFGFLGLNGAGKSTTFNMLAGFHNASSGEARLDSEILCGPKTPSASVLRQVGYCPQTDPLLDELTAREHLHFYARIRNLSSKDETAVVNSLIERMGLESYADKPSHTYSGGTKRKLSAALALIGDPKVVLLDEPTTGMDPGSRRFLWDFILQLGREKRLVVLTSHSMEECEALCSRLGVMVAGRLKCLGSTQHLKSKYGKGYTVTLRLGSSNQQCDHPAIFQLESLRPIFGRFNLPLSSWRLISQRHQIVELALLIARPSLSKLFDALSELRASGMIADFSVSQNTLESVFLQLATQKLPGGDCDQLDATATEELQDESLPEIVTYAC